MIHSSAPTATSTPTSTAARTRPLFYPAMGVAVTLLVVVGFAPRYVELVTAPDAPARPLVHVHAAVFFTWLPLFIAQTWLAGTGRIARHRRVGTAGGVLAGVMLLLGVATAIEGARRGRMPGGPYPDALAFLVVPLGDILLFAGFTAAGLRARRQPDRHRRLMLLGTLGGLLWPAIVRLPGVAGRFPLMLAVLIAFVLASPVRDLVTRRRVHPVDLWGGALVIASIPLRIVIGLSPAWHAVATWLVR